MVKRLVFLILVVSLQLKCFGGKDLDSLQKTILQMPDGIAKVDAINTLSWEFEFDEPERAMKLSEQALELAKKLGYKKGQAQSLNDIGVCYSVLGDTKKTIAYYIESLKIKEEIKDHRGIGISYINIGQVYTDQKQFDKAEQYYNQALAQFKKINNEIEVAATYNSLGILFIQQNRLDTGKACIEKALELRLRNNDEAGVNECYNNLAVIYKRLGDKRKAIKYYELGYRYDKSQGLDYNTTISLNNISTLYAELGELDKAIDMAKQSADISVKKGFLENIQYSYGNLAEYYQKKNDYSKAYLYLSRYIVIYDSLKNQDLALTLNDLTIKYETEKKDQQNKLLQAQNDLSKKTIKEQRLITYFIIAGLVLVTLLAYFIFRGLRKQRKANLIISEQKQLVELQKNLVEEKHKEITDSINYAERIQRSFMATKDLLDKNLRDYFVYFQPKDVVSGDFYWASELNNGSFALVVADSTGHGVPGAIMSILNISSLENAVKEQAEPSAILNHTRYSIIERLKKDGSPEGGKDGMDASLLCIDKTKKKLSYASANNPILIVRNKEIIELEPDKMPIGKHDKDKIPFAQGTQDLQEGDVIYALTDGFPDQFGGPKGKKFMYKKLKELLISIAHAPMSEQKDIISSTLNNWKGKLEQVDDICVVGVRI